MTLKTIGSDSELIIMDSMRAPISSHRFLQAPKDKPQLYNGFNLQNDGPLLEFAIDPTESFEQFNDYIEKALAMSKAIIGLNVISKKVSVDYLELNQEEAVLGCEPSFNVWDMSPCAPSVDDLKYQGLSKFMRTASGHIHLGYTNESDLSDDDFKLNLGRMLDVYLGTWSVLNDPDRRRRMLYGKAGDIRDKSYGLEYRTLSSFWVHDYNMRKIVYERTHAAYVRAQEVLVHNVIKPSHLIDGINNYDMGTCDGIYRQVK